MVSSHASFVGVDLHESTIDVHHGVSLVALAIGRGMGLQPSTGSSNDDEYIDCAHGTPLPGGHSSPAGIALTVVQEPSQFAGPAKFKVEGCATSQVPARNMMLFGDGEHVPSIGPQMHEGHPGAGVTKPKNISPPNAPALFEHPEAYLTFGGPK